METIYFSLVKSGLKRFVQAIHDRAVSEDSGVGGYFRNTKLSGDKKSKVNEFIQEIHQLKPDDKTDAELKEYLEELVFKYGDELLDICQLNYDKNEGVTEGAVDNIYSVISKPYIFLKQQELIDTNTSTIKGDNPQAVLAYFCCRYTVEHMTDRVMARFGFSESVSGHPKLSRQKEKLFVDSLKKCSRNINGIDKELPDYQDRVVENVTESIGAMRSQLTSLCRQATMGTKQSVVSLSLLGSVDVSSSYTPDEGMMKTYLIAADEMVKHGKSITDALNTKAITTEVPKL